MPWFRNIIKYIVFWSTYQCKNWTESSIDLRSFPVHLSTIFPAVIPPNISCCRSLFFVLKNMNRICCFIINVNIYFRLKTNHWYYWTFLFIYYYVINKSKFRILKCLTWKQTISFHIKHYSLTPNPSPKNKK